MSQQNHLLLAIMFMLFMTARITASDETASTKEEAAGLATRLMAAVAVIERQHFDPPSHQTLVHRLMTSVCYELQSPLPPGLDDELSLPTAISDLESYFARTIETALSERSEESKSLQMQALEYRAIETLLGSLPGSNSIQTRKENVVQEQLAGNRYVGIGIVLSMDKDKQRPKMIRVIENGPAHLGGILENDLILEVDGSSTKGLDLSAVIDRLRGPLGSEVMLKVQDAEFGEVRTLTLTRDVVPFKHVSRDGPVITVTQLTSSTVQELRNLEAEMADSDGPIVLKLERVLGSNLHHAVLLADALLDGGPIGQVRTRHSVREFTASRECLFRGRRIRVVVSKKTSGAVEWVVAALQDNGRVRVAGFQTAGHPFICEGFEVPGTDWVLQLTNGILERADGRRLVSNVYDEQLQRLASELGPNHPKVMTRLTHQGGVIPDIKPPPLRDDPLNIFPRRVGGRPAHPQSSTLIEKLPRSVEDLE